MQYLRRVVVRLVRIRGLRNQIALQANHILFPSPSLVGMHDCQRIWSDVIPVPLSLLSQICLLLDFIGQLYMVSKSSQEESGKEAGEGVEIVRNEPYEADDPINKHKMPKGQYT
jgi:Phosphatidylinositol transfer protein